MENPTHMLLKNDKLLISPNLVDIFEFLIEIEKEVQTMLNFTDKQEQIRLQSMEVFDFVVFLAKKLEDNNIDFGEFKMKYDISKFADNFWDHPPTRSQFIILFAYLETCFSLESAYKYEKDDEDSIRKILMATDNSKKFINNFLLTEKNDFYKKNKRFKQVSAKQIRSLRNTLSHFYSTSWNISINPEGLSKKSRKIEGYFKQEGRRDIFFISPNELFELISKWNKLLLEKWSNDYKEDSEKFEMKIKYVKSIIGKFWAKLMKWWDINI